MRKRKTTAIASTALVAAMVLVGCAADGGETELTESGPISFWVMGNKGPVAEEFAAAFTEETGIEVEVQAIPWGEVRAKVATAAASGSGPDVIQAGLDRLAEWNDAGILADISESLDEYPELAVERFVPASAETMVVDGSTVSVPWITDTRVLYYRTDLLAEAGFDGPPQTWEELTAAATALAARGEGQHGLGINLEDQTIPLVLTWSAGGDVVEGGEVRLDDASFATAIEYEHSFFADGLTPPRMQKDEDMIAGFKSGSIPMFISGPYMSRSIADQAPELEGSWDVAVIPAKSSATSLLAGSNLAVFASSTNVSASLEFMSYLVRDDVQRDWNTATNDLPAVQAVLDSLSDSDPRIAVYTAQLADSQAIPLVANWGAISQEINRARQEINLGEADITSTLEKLATTIEGL